MAVSDALIRQVGSLLGFLGETSAYARPDANTIARWLLEGQQYLAAELVPDAIPELWRTTQETASDEIPGVRVVSVIVGSHEARHISLKEASRANTVGGLFSGSVSSPKWWTQRAETVTGTWKTVIRWAPEGSYALVTFIEAPALPDVAASGEILLGPHFHPALVDWALARARHADDDDAGAGAARSAVRGLVQSLNALHGGRQAVLVEPGARD